MLTDSQNKKNNLQKEEDYFEEFVKVLDEISKISSRLDIILTISDYFKTLKSLDSTIAVCYLSVGSLFPSYENKELNIGDNIILRLISDVTMTNLNKIKEEYKKIGDFGDLILKFKVQKRVFDIKKKRHSVLYVFNKLKEVCEVQGKHSNENKLKIIRGLVRDMTSLERKYFLRILEGKLKIGLALQSVLIGLSKSFDCNEVSASKSESSDEEEKEKENNKSEIIKTAYNRLLSFEILLENIKKHGINDLLEYCKVKPGIPLKPMLAEPSKNIEEIFKKVQARNKETEILKESLNCYVEYKYDGERIQIHKFKNTVSLYSRNIENQISKYLDIVPIVKSLNEKDFILDSEIVAFNKKENKILPFQVLATRKKKVKNVNEIDSEVCIMCFDVLFFNEKDLLSEKLEKRKEILRENFKEQEGVFQFTKTNLCNTTEEIEVMLDESIKNNCEGLMIKSSNGTYLPSKRSSSWIKLKKDYINNIGDTFDLILMGVYFGKGKRTGAYGGFLIGSYDSTSDSVESICKLGTGFDETFLLEFYKKYKDHETEIKPSNFVSSSVIPDKWIDKNIIWEIKAAEISLSPVYDSCKKILKDKGVSLRFPRFIKERIDKKIEDSTTSRNIYDLYKEL